MALEYFPCYHSYGKKCEKLTDQELGRLFRALFKYSETGERQELAGRESIAFDFIADDIDRAKEAYEVKCQKNRANASERKRTQANGNETSQDKDKDKDKDKEKNSEIPGGISESTPPRVAKQKHGQYGWVRLTQEEYSRLLEELGEAELRRCIEYVDESAQGNGNKNRWKDWNLVIRKCHRDGWGLKGKPKQVYSSYTGQEGPTEDEYEQMQRFLRKLDSGKENGVAKT